METETVVEIVQDVIEPFNKYEPFVPTEFAFIDYARSWKKCRCGRVALMRDNWCGGCGQKLGMPEWKE